VGYPKIIPTFLADHVEKKNLQNQLSFNLYVGASVGPDIEDRWANLGMTKQRWPFISGKAMARKINSGEILMGDAHLSNFAKGFEYGSYSAHKLDIGIIEASSITEEGGIILGGAVGIAPEICQRAEKIIIEINTRLPDFRGMHDIIRCKKPPHRRPYLISRVDDRIGEAEIMDFDRDQIVAIIESDKKDNGSLMSPLDDQSKKISDHLMNFFEENVKMGTLPPNLYPIQSGVGNIANAVVINKF
jgi:acetyl-CoA hydrolase